MCDDEPTSFTLITSVNFCQPNNAVYLLENATGKDTTYFDKDGFIQKTPKGTVYKEMFSPVENNPNLILHSSYYNSGQIKLQNLIDKKKSLANITDRYKDLNSNSGISTRNEFLKNCVITGKSSNWYSNGQLKSQLNYSMNKLTGEQLYYAEDGSVTNQATFENGKLINGNIPLEKEFNSPYTVIEQMPIFPGGDQKLLEYLNSSIKYPVSAMQRKISGKVVLKFVIDSDGYIGKVEILRSIDPELDNEAVRVIQGLPNFIPGTQNGVNVAVWYTLPITYKLDASSNLNNFPTQNNNFNDQKSFPSRRY
jgi:TonB family protein